MRPEVKVQRAPGKRGTYEQAEDQDDAALPIHEELVDYDDLK